MTFLYIIFSHISRLLPSIFSRIRLSIGSLRVNIDLSLVSSSIQLYELPHVDQEIFLYQNQVSDFYVVMVYIFVNGIIYMLENLRCDLQS